MTTEGLEHTSEIELRLHAPTWRELLAEAARTLSARLWAGTIPAPRHANGTWREIRVRATDRAALLIDWLNELLYYAEAEWWLPAEFIIDEATDQSIHARVRGVPVETAPAEVKAATLYGVKVVPGPDGLEATVVFDV